MHHSRLCRGWVQCEGSRADEGDQEGWPPPMAGDPFSCTVSSESLTGSTPCSCCQSHLSSESLSPDTMSWLLAVVKSPSHCSFWAGGRIPSVPEVLRYSFPPDFSISESGGRSQVQGWSSRWGFLTTAPYLKSSFVPRRLDLGQGDKLNALGTFKQGPPIWLS